MEYLDFDLEIGAGDGLTYPVSVHSPAGEARETMRFPYNRDRMELRLKDLEIALLRSGSIARQVLPPELQSVQDMGKDFFNALFCGEVRSRYDVSQNMAREQGKGLRVRLRVQSGELSALPWEYLYDPRACEYVCLSTGTPLVRYLEVPQIVKPIKVDLPLRMLGMVCSPADLPALDVDQEKKRVEEALVDLQKRGLVKLTWLSGETWSDLQDALLEGPWHVFHFIGHGGFDPQQDEGYLAFTGANSKTHPMHATELARLLADHRELRVVVLNACQGARSSWESIFSSTAAVLVRRGIACTLAMQFSISDSAAVELARRFYTMLAKGLPVDAALTEARKALSIAFAHSVEWGTPVLFMRSPDGTLFKPKVAQPGESVEPKPDMPAPHNEINTNGGAVVEGSVTTSGGDFVGRDQTIIDGNSPESANGGEDHPAPFRSDLPVPVDFKGRIQRLEDRIWVQLIGDVGMGFVRVPAGNFWMGSDLRVDMAAEKNEQPRHTVWLDEYWIGRYPVSCAQYAAFIQATGRDAPKDWNSGKVPPGKVLFPVVNISWEDAAAFCSWAGVHLPTEAQWEKAARGTDGHIYPWGNKPPTQDRCNINQWFHGTTPADQFGIKGESPYGCRDMAGNVLEWCADWFDEDFYQHSPEKNPTGPLNGVLRVMRGGSWLSREWHARCAFRMWNDPSTSDMDYGFRVVIFPSSL